MISILLTFTFFPQYILFILIIRSNYSWYLNRHDNGWCSLDYRANRYVQVGSFFYFIISHLFCQCVKN